MVPFTGSGEELESTMLSLGQGKVGKMKMRVSRDVGIDNVVAIKSSHYDTLALG